MCREKTTYSDCNRSYNKSPDGKKYLKKAGNKVKQKSAGEDIPKKWKVVFVGIHFPW
jgi:hypothetical protein